MSRCRDYRHGRLADGTVIQYLILFKIISIYWSEVNLILLPRTGGYWDIILLLICRFVYHVILLQDRFIYHQVYLSTDDWCHWPPSNPFLNWILLGWPEECFCNHGSVHSSSIMQYYLMENNNMSVTEIRQDYGLLGET